MNLYLNYAREHWTNEGENPLIGLNLCADKDEAVAHYTLANLGNRIAAPRYELGLPEEAQLAAEIEKARKQIAYEG